MLFEEQSKEAEECTDTRDSNLDEEKTSLQPILAQTLYTTKQKVTRGLQVPLPMLHAEIPESGRSKTHFRPLLQGPPKLHAVFSNPRLAIVFGQCSTKENCWDFLKYRRRKSENEKGCCMLKERS